MSRQRQSTTVERKNKQARKGRSTRSKSKNKCHARSTTANELGDIEDAVVDDYRQILSGIINTMSDGVIVVDRHLKVVAMNRAAQLITGFDNVDGVTRTCAEICRSNRCGVACPMADAFTSGEEPPEVEMQILTKSNEMRTVRARVRLLRNSDGEIIGGMKIMRDITAQKRPRSRGVVRESFGALIGKSRAMQQLYQLIEDISDSIATVLIYGETGTGKELVAHAIHENSPRRNGPFIKVNCGAIPETLLEAELFGYVRGAFTDAVTDKPGRFELAHGGTIFLDEIGEISPAVQVKLLRVLQEREFERLGGIQTIKVDVRVIAATNRNLRQAVQNRQFREDLYYRLNVIPIYIPPLRERREDIPLLVKHFAEKFRNETKRPIEGISPEAMAIFIEYDWPGNV
ncbi:MAG TPA: PAS domain-containing protein, partial [Armatimonadetes bacterium]|nr:PAS domain-containing protein [Armatimonadota bacterium]